MPKKPAPEATGIIQASVVKKCDRAFHRPGSSRACAARDSGEVKGACQHTCDPAQAGQCAHKWTVRYSVSSRQRGFVRVM